VTHHGTEEAKRAGRTYLGILMGTSVGFLLLALVWTWMLAGTTDFRPGGILAGRVESGLVLPLLALYAFGTGKAALMPFHRWLPAAMVAPTPVSALLHAVAVVKAGVFTVLKVVVYVFGFDLLRTTGAGLWLAWVAATTLLLASIIALYQDHLKRRLAYSTISQLAYIVLGAALANEIAARGAGLHILLHAVGKITLFFCAGAIYVASHKKYVSELDGLGRRMPFTFFAFFLGSCSIIGLPPAAGFWPKLFLALGAAEAGQKLLVAVFMISTLFSIGYLMQVVWRGFFGQGPEDSEPGLHNDLRSHPLLVGPPLFTGLCTLALVFSVDFFSRLLEGMFQ
jgi:multicomponent Na+:H+ antiporter subunit D